VKRSDAGSPPAGRLWRHAAQELATAKLDVVLKRNPDDVAFRDLAAVVPLPESDLGHLQVAIAVCREVVHEFANEPLEAPAVVRERGHSVNRRMKRDLVFGPCVAVVVSAVLPEQVVPLIRLKFGENQVGQIAQREGVVFLVTLRALRLVDHLVVDDVVERLLGADHLRLGRECRLTVRVGGEPDRLDFAPPRFVPHVVREAGWRVDGDAHVQQHVVGVPEPIQDVRTVGEVPLSGAPPLRLRHLVSRGLWG
jgi:hypothetical protein